MRRAAGTRLAVAGRWRRTASTHPSTVNRSSSANDRPSLMHCSTAEQAAEVHQRRVDDRDPSPQLEGGITVRLVVLGCGEHPLERVVAEIDPLRRAGGAAREHAHRGARSTRDGCAPPPAPGRTRSGWPRSAAATVVAAEPAGTRSSRSWRSPASTGSPSERDVVPRALTPPPGVDGDHAAAGGQDAEEESHRRRPVAQEDADFRTGPLDHRRDLRHGVGELRPRAPRPVELDRVRRGIHRQDVADAGRETAACGRQRNLGSVRAAARSATSAIPRGSRHACR